jgi:hypothetical protein
MRGALLGASSQPEKEKKEEEEEELWMPLRLLRALQSRTTRTLSRCCQQP